MPVFQKESFVFFPSALPSPLFPLGQQTAFHLSASLSSNQLSSTKNCQPSTNTGQAINTISHPLPSFPSLFLFIRSLPLFSSFLHCSIIHFYNLHISATSPVLFPALFTILVLLLSSILCCFSPLLLVFVVVHSR